MRTERTMATDPNASETVAKEHSKQSEIYSISTYRSRGKTRESLSEQIAKVLIYLQTPRLTLRERLQSWQLFESTLRRYVTIRHLGGYR